VNGDHAWIFHSGAFNRRGDGVRWLRVGGAWDGVPFVLRPLRRGEGVRVGTPLRLKAPEWKIQA
jgi:hypothetical protein